MKTTWNFPIYRKRQGFQKTRQPYQIMTKFDFIRFIKSLLKCLGRKGCLANILDDQKISQASQIFSLLRPREISRMKMHVLIVKSKAIIRMADKLTKFFNLGYLADDAVIQVRSAFIQVRLTNKNYFLVFLEHRPVQYCIRGPIFSVLFYLSSCAIQYHSSVFSLSLSPDFFLKRRTFEIIQIIGSTMSSVKLTAQFVLIALLAATNVLSVPTPINPKSANSHKFWERTTNFDENYAFVKRHSPGSSDYTPSNQENTDQPPEATPTPTVTSPTSQNNSDYTPSNEGSQSPEEGYPPTATSPTSKEDCNDAHTDDYSGQPPAENAPDNTIQSPTEQSPSIPQNEGTDEQPSGDTLKGNSDYTPSNQENTDQLPEATPTPTAASPTSKEDCNDTLPDDYSDEGKLPREDTPSNGGPSSTGEGKSNYAASTQ
ncbi:hypothetical protein O181_072674 [Austropuccinia psidii MF-1]|uniref:Uncharacterized protein n=1 Tax=Austropuccinia psidii MF-1 TaxID=1389203 RepID=A0A9Q3IBQ7_9BASI|nr:hypothetical protein [Austropuccinia psidii MF-1]